MPEQKEQMIMGSCQASKLVNREQPYPSLPVTWDNKLPDCQGRFELVLWLTLACNQKHL